MEGARVMVVVHGSLHPRPGRLQVVVDVDVLVVDVGHVGQIVVLVRSPDMLLSVGGGGGVDPGLTPGSGSGGGGGRCRRQRGRVSR